MLPNLHDRALTVFHECERMLVRSKQVCLTVYYFHGYGESLTQCASPNPTVMDEAYRTAITSRVYRIINESRPHATLTVYAGTPKGVLTLVGCFDSPYKQYSFLRAFEERTTGDIVLNDFSDSLFEPGSFDASLYGLQFFDRVRIGGGSAAVRA